MRSLFAAALVLSAATPALADESWTTDSGEIYYVEDIGATAHLMYVGAAGYNYDIYLPGLGGNYDRRGTFEGYFLVQGADVCDSELVGENGWGATYWGKALVIFDNPGFPSGFDLYFGDCNLEEVDNFLIRAEPL